MISVLVTGKDSQLAQCIRDLQENCPEISFDFKNSKELDITSEQSVAKTFKAKTYDYCVNCAAYTAVDKAEIEPQKAKLVNTIGVKNLALACKRHNVVLIHISTDFVFDGKKKTPYTEEDQTNPINVYGKTKRDGEIEIQKTLKRYFIIRTSWLYSNHSNNFVRTILRLSNEKEEIDVVNDQIGCPTYASDLSVFICKIITLNSEHYGIYHFSNEGKATWYGFAKQIIEYWQLNLKLNSVNSNEYITKAKRPGFSVLDTSKAKHTFEIITKEWKSSLYKCFLSYDIQ
ncbi:dTDP-4-dehydrorhamnose reductase [Winogradskyella jejuensis]|uniref:dTDP-4-dehydrorhamnose reductase n=1 Tax=Winogradskyella jejuensis TaxID=1089305 RepID=A0A1M5MUM6_9FLAO|nr:dTDP-4-dehydrorhamnose reductase [Winogradskyella jejuensis]SHG80877.1 dTDP-4-dehydrorhamnose reductase [Winogradskyella jejuensis]